MYYILPVGVLVFNLCIVIYLYGDLSIYAAAVPKSIRDISWYVYTHSCRMYEYNIL